MGTAPGAYLVDIKVLTDAGGTNSQYSISGIQWMINNADTDWGHNSSGRGIQNWINVIRLSLITVKSWR